MDRERERKKREGDKRRKPENRKEKKGDRKGWRERKRR